MNWVPKEKINERIVEVQVPLLSEETVEVLKLVPQERFNERIVDVPEPQKCKETVERWNSLAFVLDICMSLF